MRRRQACLGTEGMRSSNLAAALRELERDGLVVRTPDAEDRRKVRVRLTPTGREALYENITRREQWLAEAIEQSLTKEERALLFASPRTEGRRSLGAPQGLCANPA